MATPGTKRRRRRRLLISLVTSSAGLWLAALLVVAAIFGSVVALSDDEDGSGNGTTGGKTSNNCPGAGVTVDVNLPAGTVVAGLPEYATKNAAIISQVAWDRGLGDNGAAIGLAAAMAETDLRNMANDGTSTLNDAMLHRQLNSEERAVAKQSLAFPHDDVGSNLDSIGLFQQRPMMNWGPPQDLIDPAKSAGIFYNRLIGQIPNWSDMKPWNAAQEVQGSPSSDGGIYKNKYDQATRIVSELKTVISDTPSRRTTTGTTTPPATGTSAPATSSTTTTTSGGISTVSAPAPTAVDAAGPCNGGGGGVGAPVAFDGNITISAPSGTYTVPLPEGPRGAFLQAVATKMGSEYVWAAAGPDVFDCSGLMSWGLIQAGIQVGRLTADQFRTDFPAVPPGSEQAGDVVLFGARFEGDGTGRAGHIGVVIDPAQKLMMHTYSSSAPASISRYDAWDGGPLGFTQVVPDGAGAITTTSK